MSDDTQRIPTKLGEAGDYTPSGEDQGVHGTFTASSVAEAFGVERSRVEAAMAGEFQLDAGAEVDSQQAQHLSEVILGDQPMDQREAGLITLGAFTPRADHDTGLGERTGGIESDRLVRNADWSDEERG